MTESIVYFTARCDSILPHQQGSFGTPNRPRDRLLSCLLVYLRRVLRRAKFRAPLVLSRGVGRTSATSSIPVRTIDRQGLSTLALCQVQQGVRRQYAPHVAACHHHMSRGGLINRTCSHDKLAKGSLTKHLIITANCSIHYRLIGEPQKGLCYTEATAAASAVTWSVSLYFCRNFIYITIRRRTIYVYIGKMKK